MSDHFARRVRAFIDEQADVLAGLSHEGPRVVDLAMACRRIGLRELARRTGLSPTYLCRVRYGDVRISASAYLTVEAIARGK